MTRASRLLTVAGAAQVRSVRCGPSLLLPVELRHVNHTASTNTLHSKAGALRHPYNASSLP